MESGWRRTPSAAVASYFTEDAIFQGLRPYRVGRQGVAEYYASQPLGLAAAYQILETRRPAEDLVLYAPFTSRRVGQPQSSNDNTPGSGWGVSRADAN
jgi:hypothetical protein